ncbi:MAG: hydroxypyruvate isomerase family protein [Burkholderiaceae bacterium]|nr:hydroxypyruvate isomerase family protein [Burkholderiaceae bacterium]
MPRFAANLSMMYGEVDFIERFGACSRDGFTAVEFLFPYAYPSQRIRDALDRHGLSQVLFNAPPGDWDAGERGTASLPGRESEFRDGIEMAIEYAKVLDCPRVHVMAGVLANEAQRAAHREVFLGNLAWAAARLGDAGLIALIEPINTRDIPGFLLNTQADAHAIVERIGAPNLKVQMDLYHCQIVEGDLAMKIRKYIAAVGHFQIAGVPQRHEPDVGEINYPYLFELIDELGFDGWIGCEYRPRSKTSEGLGWMKAVHRAK